MPKLKKSVPLHAVLEVEEKDRAAFEKWARELPIHSHGPAISEWTLAVEIAKGIKAKVTIIVPNWDEYRAACEK